jgi:hypothetical protein
MSQERPTSDIEPQARTDEAAEESDTEGSSMLVYELGLTTEVERRRHAEQASRGASRSAAPARRSLVDRLRRR